MSDRRTEMELRNAWEKRAYQAEAELRAAPASQPSVPEPITEMRMCEIPYLILHENQLYRFSVAAGCKECADYLNPPAPADPSSKEVMPIARHTAV